MPRTQKEIEQEIMWLEDKLNHLAADVYTNEKMGFYSHAQDVREKMQRVREHIRRLEAERKR